MQADGKGLYKYFQGDDTRYIIPVYQRNYNWGIKQCSQLLNDVQALIGKEQKHFFGSVVRLSDGHDGWIVIDGQQRLTTVSLMWLAMYQLIKDNKRKNEENIKTLTNNLRNKVCYDKDDNTVLPRIEHVDKDRKAYEAIINGKKEKYINVSAITRNFWFFYHKIENSPYSLKNWDEAIKKLEIANVELDLNKGDDPQAIFESLNSTGLALSDGDKIRNFILMKLPLDVQKQFYYDYWTEIESFSDYGRKRKDSDKTDAVSDFVRDYLTAKTTHIPAIRDVYTKFKQYKTDNYKESSEDLLIDMKKYAHYLFMAEKGSTHSTKINRILQRISLLGMTVLHPFEMNLMKDFEEETITENDMCSLLEVIETYVLRRSICELPTNTLNKTFAVLYDNAINLSSKEGISLYESVVYLLMSRPGNARFPKDDEFKDAWRKKNIYKMTAYKVYIFFCLNGGKSPEGDTSIIKKMLPDENGKTVLSIEHIMPQKLSSDWISELGGKEEANRIHDFWVDNVANLTLTAFNSPYSNNRFKDKLNFKNNKDEEIGFSASPLPINAFIKQQTKWGEKQLEERLSLIQKMAVETIWRMPSSSFHGSTEVEDSLTLDEDASNFTDTIFLDGSLNGTSIPVGKKGVWKEAFKDIIRMIDSDYHYELMLMAEDNTKNTLQSESTKDENSTLIVNGLYAKMNRSASELIKYLKDIFAFLGIDAESLLFHVKRKTKKEDAPLIKNNSQ